MSQQPHVAAAEGYVADVLSGAVPACKWVRLACERHRRDLESAKRKDWPYRFDAAKAERVCKFVELMPHVKGRWAAGTPKPIRLEPWQCFVTVSLFGWVSKETGARRFRKGRMYVSRKNGKALALDTPIPTPSGWRTMRDIAPGDYVYGDNGKPVEVVAESELFIGKKCYRVGFSDGSSVVASEDHLWTTRHKFRPWAAPARYPGGKIRGTGGRNGAEVTETVTTAQIAESVRVPRPDGVPESNHKIALASALESEAVDLPIDPYVLGAWLGDGTSSCAAFTCSQKDLEHLTSELERALGREMTVARDKKTAVTVRATKTGLQATLRANGLLGNKHVPDAYFSAGTEQRWALLQGLMDTDGTVTRCAGRTTARCSFTGTNERICQAVWRIARSLGLKATIHESIARLNGRDCGPKWRVDFPAARSTRVFRLERKQSLLPDALGKRSGTITITSCDEVATVPTKCIAVDSENHLFLAGDGCIPTHNTSWAAPIGLYMLVADAEPGSEVYAGATTEKQAWELFGPARQMCLKTPALVSKFGIEVNARTILRQSDMSKFEPIIGKPGDGASPHCSITDEYHEHQTDDQLATMETGMGAREQPLSLVISTAGDNLAGPCREDWLECQKILEGVIEDDRTFAVIYAADPELDWTSEAALRQANPNYDVSVSGEFLQGQLREAINNPRKQGHFKTKHLNLWVQARDAYINMQRWSECQDKTLRIEDCKGRPCFMGLDLASKVDIAALELLFDMGDGRFARFGRYYLPEETVEQSENQHYRKWRDTGLLTVTDGNIIDFSVIEEDVIALASEYGAQAVGYDPHQATMLVTRLQEAGVPVIEFRPTVLNFSEPMKQIEALIRDRKLAHDGDEVMTWAMSNVVAKLDAKDNVYPRKERVENKIDPFVALCMAMGLAMKSQDKAPEYQMFVY